MACQAGGKAFPLGELPFAMLVTVMSRTTPQDVARLAVVNRSFADVARCDLVWREFLPVDVKDIVNNAHGGPLVYDSLKALYDRLVQQVLLGDGNEGYWIDRKSGRVHRSFSARTLRVVWGETDQYWKWIHDGGSRFSEIAFLNSVCWLDVSGQINTRLPPGTYTLCWVLKFDREAYGWDFGPVTVSLTDGLEHHQTQIRWSFNAPDTERNEDWFRWSDYGIGQFTVGREDDATGAGEVNLTFSLKEISRLHWKSGLYLDGVVICPVPQKI